MVEIERLIGAAAIELRVVPPKSAAVRRCLAAYFRELAARFESGFNPGGGDPASEEEMTPPNGFFVLARLDGRAVGCGGLRRLDERVGEIKRMWTAPRARGRGVARRVLHELEVLARGAGIETLRLDTNRVLVEAQAMYRREGYREIARYNDNPYAHHSFEKKLEPTAWPGRQISGRGFSQG
jgi:GNAT superfamily N-acetyltransferase